jgi:hypothetical protein
MPFALAALAHTSVPPAQTQPPIEPLPTSGRPGDLGSEIDHVPLFSEVPDVASRAAVDAYRRVGIFDANDAKSAFVAAWGRCASLPRHARWSTSSPGNCSIRRRREIFRMEQIGSSTR